MSEFMIIAGENGGPLEAQRALLEARARFADELRSAGALLDTERLRSSSEGRRVKHRDGAAHVEAGPFADTVGTFWVVRARDLDEALALARKVPLAPDERVEVRPIMKGHYEASKADRTGRVFGFGVLGNAPNEEAWIRIMDRIDAGSDSEDFRDSLLAGVRLEAPRTGRTLLNQRGKAVVLDGPFLESREVIGGLFFMRHASLEDAVAWASSSAFAKLGAAEIREVWRS